MDLRNTKKHMRGMALTVDGRRYQLDGEGIVRGVPAEDARTLLQGKDWLVVSGKLPPAPSKQAVPQPVEQPAAAQQPVRPAAPEDNLPAPHLLPTQSVGFPLAPAPQPSDEPFPQDDEQPAISDEQPEGEQSADGEQEAGQANDAQPTASEWPPPSEEMTTKYLRDMADAFGVQVPRGAKKADLVKLILEKRGLLESSPTT